MGSIAAVCASQRRTDPQKDICEGYLRQGYGLAGNAHASLSEREASLLDLESSERPNSVLSQAEGREHGIETSPGDLGENLTTQGVDLLSLPIEIVVVEGRHCEQTLVKVSQKRL